MKLVWFLAAIIFTSLTYSSNVSFTSNYLEKLEDDLKNVKLLESSIKQRRDEIYQFSYNERVKLRGQSKKKAKKKALEDVASYDKLLELFKALAKEENHQRRLELLDLIKAFDYGLKVEGNLITYSEILEGVNGVLTEYRVLKKDDDAFEATNLVKANGEFFNKEELSKISDISKLDPVSNSPFMFKPADISKVNVREAFLNGENDLYKGTKVWWPSKNIFKLKKIRKTQSKPKLDVYADNPYTGKKETFKVKLAAEIHSEPTVASLANALGIYTDLSMYRHDIKVYLDDMTFNDFQKDWYSYFDGYDLEKLIKEKGSDENGEYIIFIDGLLEQKFKNFKTYNRVGPWAWGENDHKSFRETRGLFIFNVWVGNTDIKEAENNKLILRETENGVRPFKVMHDMGFALGNFLREKPLNFKWNAVKKENKKKVVFNFLNFQYNTGFDHITWADARWMVRKIAQLSREQISQAVSLGGWPQNDDYNLHALLVEKLISRRNGLVASFKLTGEKLENGKTIDIIPLKEVNIGKVPERIPGYTIDFRSELKEIFNVPLNALPEALLGAMKAGIGAISKIEIDPVELGLDEGLISQVLINVKREVIRNPDPRNVDETFIVRDDFLIGFRLGFGIVLSGDVAYYKKYSLIQGAKTEKEAKYKNNFFLNLTLPRDVLVKKLPLNHVLVVSDFVEKRGRVKLTNTTVDLPIASFLGVEGTFSRIDLGRTVISKDEDKRIVLFDDTSKYNRAALKAFVELGVLKVPFITMDKEYGLLNRNIFKLNLDEISNSEQRKALTNAINFHDHSKIRKLGQREELKSSFVESNNNFNLFGLLGLKTFKRKDYITYYGDVESKSDDTNFFQLERSNRKFWNSFISGEKFMESAKFIGKRLDDGSVENGVLKLEYVHDDKRTKASEIENKYLYFFNGVAKKKNFLNFSASAHSSNDEYGHMDAKLNLEIYKAGLDKIQELTREDLYEFATKLTGYSLNTLREVKRPQTNNRRGSNRKFFKFNDKNINLKSYVYDLDKLARMLKKSKKEPKYLLNAFYKGVSTKGGTYDPLLLNTLLNFVDSKDYYLKAQLYPHEGKENKLPERVIPFNSEGERKEVSEYNFITDMEDTLGLFTFFRN